MDQFITLFLILKPKMFNKAEADFSEYYKITD